ncbi:LysR family transcriptional regulator [Rhizobium lemnae]|uniref:LysR family transcriptional regulator n=1 Tax=Rhizobium lemnae TaxID=1214924 RepID=A0ABV8E4V3_9HYPH|nr:LysR family transcriptional regulator [Rhizobium lemnae]
MDWRDLHVLATLCREGSLAGAARSLGVNHATISRRISALEDEVGERLVRRLARSTPLTEKGREIAAMALEMARQSQLIERLVHSSKGMITGTVRLTAPPAFISETLIPSLPDFRKRHPNLRLILSADSHIASLDKGDADIAVRLVEPTGQQNIVRRLGNISYALYATHEYALHPTNDWQFIGFDAALADTPQQAWLERYADGRTFSLLVSDFYSQRAAAEAGLGIALLPERIAETSEKLVRIDDRQPLPRSAWLVIHADLKKSSAVRAISDHLIRLFGADAGESGPGKLARRVAAVGRPK